MTACQVFINEIARIRSARDAWPLHSPSGEDELLSSLQIGIAALNAFSHESSMMSKSPPARYVGSRLTACQGISLQKRNKPSL